MPALFRPSGGLLYHCRALRSKARWREFNAELEAWLNSWRKPEGELVLVGPSGGHTLPTAWLRGFRRIHAYDLDPLAEFFFSLRHKLATVDFHREDVFWRGGKLSTAAIEELRVRHSGAAILFCNVLGQLPLENRVSEADLHRYLKRLRASLQGSAWASYHDLFTAEPLPASRHSSVARVFTGGKDLERGVPGMENLELIDHGLRSDWTEGLESRRLAWPLHRQSLHLIEAVHA